MALIFEEVLREMLLANGLKEHIQVGRRSCENPSYRVVSAFDCESAACIGQCAASVAIELQ
jgi:hypothetical protein